MNNFSRFNKRVYCFFKKCLVSRGIAEILYIKMCLVLKSHKQILFNIEVGKDICVNVTCLGSCNFLLSKAT